MMKKSFLLAAVLSLIVIAGCGKQAANVRGSGSAASSTSPADQTGAAPQQEPSKPNEAKLREKDAVYVQAALEKKDPKLCEKLYAAADQARCKELVKRQSASADTN